MSNSKLTHLRKRSMTKNKQLPGRMARGEPSPDPNDTVLIRAKSSQVNQVSPSRARHNRPQTHPHTASNTSETLSNCNLANTENFGVHLHMSAQQITSCREPSLNNRVEIKEDLPNGGYRTIYDNIKYFHDFAWGADLDTC